LTKFSFTLVEIRRYLILLLGMISLSACQTDQRKLFRTGTWRATLTTENGAILPFNFEVRKQDDTTMMMYILNGRERIGVDDIEFSGDSVWIKMPVFDSEFRAKFQDVNLKGNWIKHYADTSISMSFSAVPESSFRFFSEKQIPSQNIAGKWQCTFSDNEGNTYPAVGVFEQDGDRVTGTFLTETGDYRFLEGQLKDNVLYLSCFDGSHAFLFTAEVNSDSTLSKGFFYSGNSYKETWTAIKNDNASLKSPEELTFVKPGLKFDFSFPDLNGNNVSLSSPQLQNKVKIIQIMGSWCPNCMDETAYFRDLYRKYQEQGLEIVGIAFERNEQLEQSKPLLDKLISRFGIAYPILFGGKNDKEQVSNLFPMLNKVMAFPTTIVLDRNNKVRRIHTGFNGPGTGEYYINFTSEFDKFIEQLINEK
jgi:thiol-disulfide isomerase/thioredoxin